MDCSLKFTTCVVAIGTASQHNLDSFSEDHPEKQDTYHLMDFEDGPKSDNFKTFRSCMLTVAYVAQ